MPLNRAIGVLKVLAQEHTKFITLDDLCRALDMPLEQCTEILGKCEEMGLVRRTKSDKGASYIWLGSKLGED